MSETQMQPGGNRVPAATRVAVDGTTIRGDGSEGSPLRAVASQPFFALASIENSEGAQLVSGENIDSVSYSSPNLLIVLTTPVPDVDKVNIQVTIRTLVGPPCSVSASMQDDSTISVQFLTGVEQAPALLACFVSLALVP